MPDLVFDAGNRAQHGLLISIINLGEVFYLSVKAKDLSYGEHVLRSIRAHLVSISATDELVLLAASLKARHAISYADAFAAATAISHAAPLVTCDPELLAMSTVERSLKLHWIG